MRLRRNLLLPNSPGKPGFSLVEVLLAIGVVVFALLVIFSTIGVGQASLEETNRQSIETQIFDEIGAELRSTPFDALDTFHASRFPIRYNGEGYEAAAEDDAVFIVRCNLSPAELGAGELRRATLSIGYHRDPDTADPKMPKPARRTILLVNRGG